MKQTPKHNIKYPEGTDLVRNASAQFEAMAQSIDDNIDDLPDTITQKVTDAQAKAEAAATQAEKFGGQAQALQDTAVRTLIDTTDSQTRMTLDTLIGRDLDQIVFLGDSISAGLGVAETERWPRLLCDMLGLTERNYAVSGATVEQFDGQLDKAIADGGQSRVKYVFVCGGVNNQPGDPVEDTITTLLPRIHKNFPRALVIVGSVPMGYNLLLGSGNSQTWWNRRGLAMRMKRAAYTQQCTVLDMSDWYIRDASLLQGDNMHPNAAGHRQIAGRTYATLNGVAPVSAYLPLLVELGGTSTPAGATLAEDTHISLLMDDYAAWLNIRFRFTITDKEAYSREGQHYIGHLPQWMSDNDAQPSSSTFASNYHELLVSIADGQYQGLMPPWIHAWISIRSDGGIFLLDRYDTNQSLGWQGMDNHGVIEYQATIALPRYGYCIPATL